MNSNAIFICFGLLYRHMPSPEGFTEENIHILSLTKVSRMHESSSNTQMTFLINYFFLSVEKGIDKVRCHKNKYEKYNFSEEDCLASIYENREELGELTKGYSIKEIDYSSPYENFQFYYHIFRYVKKKSINKNHHDIYLRIDFERKHSYSSNYENWEKGEITMTGSNGNNFSTCIKKDDFDSEFEDTGIKYSDLKDIFAEHKKKKKNINIEYKDVTELRNEIEKDESYKVWVIVALVVFPLFFVVLVISFLRNSGRLKF